MVKISVSIQLQTHIRFSAEDLTWLKRLYWNPSTLLLNRKTKWKRNKIIWLIKNARRPIQQGFDRRLKSVTTVLRSPPIILSTLTTIILRRGMIFDLIIWGFWIRALSSRWRLDDRVRQSFFPTSKHIPPCLLREESCSSEQWIKETSSESGIC